MTQERPVVEVSYPPDFVTRLFNPMARFALSTPLGGPLRRRYMLLHFTGHKSGRQYVVPVTVHRDGDRLYVLTGARWRVNFRGGADVEVTLDGHTTPMRGELVEDPETVAPVYARRIEEYGLRMARVELAVKINVPRVPTVPELIEAVRREGLSVIWLQPKS